MYRVLSLGAGVQSSALFLLSCRGIIPKADCAVFADTGWEPPNVYQQLERLKEEGEKAGIPVHTVSNGNIVDAFFEQGEKGFAAIPIFSKAPDGSVSMGRRQCTREFKIAPVEKFVRREVLGLKPRQRGPKTISVEMWIGISLDEIQRMKDARTTWQVNVYPFCQWPQNHIYLEKSWTRLDCSNWLAAKYPDITFGRSACLGCPYHHDREWVELKQDPALWKEIVDFDHRIRKGRKEYQQFLHKSCVPIDDVDFSTAEDYGQMNLWDNECDGMCGL